MEELTTTTNETPEEEIEDKSPDTGEVGDVSGDETGEEEETEEPKKEETEEPDADVEDFEPETRGEEEKVEEETKDDEIDPDDAAIIDKKVQARVAPLERKLQQQADLVEVSTYVSENPEFAKYKGAILKYISHPAYSKIPVENIARIVAGKDLQRIGAQKERETQKKVAGTKTTGSSVRPSKGGVTNWETASDEEYEAERARVLGHQG